MPAQGPLTPAAVMHWVPAMSVSVVIAGRALPTAIVSASWPLKGSALKPITSLAPPAAHSPAMAPDAVLVLAEPIASRSVQMPSLAAVSTMLLTVIGAAAAETGRSSSASAARPPA
jgi:hypothetical protein